MFAAAAAALTLAFGVPVQCPAPAAYQAELVRDVGELGHAAFFSYATGTVWLSTVPCGELGDLMAGVVPVRIGRAPAGYAVFVLAHELAHAAGIRDEATADCRAAASFFDVAARIGVPVGVARWLAWSSGPIDGYSPEVSGACFSPLADPLWPWRQ